MTRVLCVTLRCAVSLPAVRLVEGDRISLVLSVAPLVEQFFTFRAGEPRDPDLADSEEHSWVGSTHSTAGVFSPGAVHSNRWVEGSEGSGLQAADASSFSRQQVTLTATCHSYTH